jgi:hypothetical protein
MKEKLKLKILFCLFGLATLTFTGCVKQSDCDCGVKGKFIYNPYWSDAYNTKINAHFVPDGSYSDIYKIEGFIPDNFRITDTIYVSICTTVRENTPHQDDVRPIYKLKCIEIAK